MSAGRQTGQAIVKSTMILVAGNIVVKIIGALFKLPLANIIGADGMGLYNASFNVYDIFLVIATAGFPLAISKMVARSDAHGGDGDALRIFVVSRRLFLGIGLASATAMMLGARTYARLIGNTRSFNCIVVLAPAVLFVSLMSAYRGFYQGTNDMIPTTVSQVIEAVVRLVIGLSLAWELKRRGFSGEIVAAGSIAGITVGEFSSTFSLSMLHHFRSRRRKIHRRGTLPSADILKAIFKTSMPIAFSTLIISFLNMLDNSVVMHRLQSIGYTEEQANTLYGCFNMAFTVFSLPITIVAALTTSIFPVLSYAYACRDNRTVARVSAASLRMAMLAATGSAAMFCALSYPLVNLLYFNRPQDAAVAAPLLMLLGPSAITLSLSMLTTSILQAIDHLLLPSRSMIVGGAACLVLNWLLVGQKSLGIYATPVGIFVCYLITTLMNLAAIRKSGRIPLSMKNLLFRPLLPAAGMAVVGMFSFQFLLPRAGLIAGALLSLNVSLVIFVLLLFLNRSIESSDLEILPHGRKLVRLLIRFRLLPKPKKSA